MNEQRLHLDPKKRQKQPFQRVSLFRTTGNWGRSSFTQTGQPSGLPREVNNVSRDTITQHFTTSIISRVQPHSPIWNNLVPCRNCQSKKIEISSEEFEETAHQPIDIGNSAGVHHPFHFSTKNRQTPKTHSDAKEETKLVDQEIQEMLSKGTIKITEKKWKTSF